MPHDSYLTAIISGAFLLGLAACQTVTKTSDDLPSAQEHIPTADEKAAWLKHEGLLEATAEETVAASAGEIRFNKAILPDKEFRFVFKMGTRQSVSGTRNSGPQTTTSYYALKSFCSGNTVARIASSLSAEDAKEMGYKQKILISHNGQRLLIYETWCDGCSYHDSVALVSAVPNGESWTVKYLKLPEFSGYAGVNDHGATPVGFAGDDLLFKTLASDKICKKNLAEIEEAEPPVPFTIG
jgi:hypothetical protein